MRPSRELPFQIDKDEYQTIRFDVPSGHSRVRIRMRANTPVDVMVLSSSDLQEYEQAKPGKEHGYDSSWSRRTEFEQVVKLAPGHWHLVLQGRDEPSGGFIEISTG